MAPPDLARSALDAAPDAMIIIDGAGIVQFANRQVSVLFGYEHDQIVGQSVEMLLPERFRGRHVGHRESYVRSLRVRPMGLGLQLFGLRCNGTEFPVEISLSPIEDVGRTLVAAAIRDVTDRKRIEAELIVAREAAEVARELADQSRELADRANQGKSRFLATASHDLRQPLQTLELLNGTLRRRITDRNCMEALSQQEQAISSMSRLLNALLDISKLESGAVRPEPTDFTVAAIFEELRLEFAGIAANKGLTLEVETCGDAVYSDPSLVEQILRNLLSNAVKYTREGCVRLRCLHDASFIRIEVLDTGVGIPADQLPYIYDEFYQVGVPTNSSRDGYGLGLSIVQRLVKLLTLQLDVRSEVGKGSAFALLLPASDTRYRAAEDCRPESSPADSARVGEAHVLVVEDNDSVRRATALLLELEGYQVTAVATLLQALQHVQQGHRVDLLISDYHLNDGETGTQVIAALREILGVSLRAVLTTGDTSSAIKQLPRDQYLRVTSKPIKADELLALLRGLLAA
ncbi:MAG TPA: ATP-binding protein [Steroidobacteraceae bacterium]|nr:ATP-binding protein [Steroidobacteraceae bacterium]